MPFPVTRPLDFARLSPDEMTRRAQSLVAEMKTRRSVRVFSDEKVPHDVLRGCLEVACSAPSGANLQPWSFVVVEDPVLKRRIREGAEEEERAFYAGRASDQWLKDLSFLDLGADKPFLEEAPALIAVFSQPVRDSGQANYYVKESVGIAVGFLIMALHQVGLCTLTHTPSPMKFLGEILGRPDHERPYVLMPVGYPSTACQVPVIGRRPLDESVTFR